jgi:hypothetical protein
VEGGGGETRIRIRSRSPIGETARKEGGRIPEPPFAFAHLARSNRAWERAHARLDCANNQICGGSGLLRLSGGLSYPHVSEKTALCF